MPTGFPTRVIVVGGGIVGLSSALALSRRGLAVTLVSSSTMVGTASWGNAGHIAVEQVEPLASWKTVRSLPGRLFCRGGALSLPPAQIAAWLPFGLRLLGATRPSQFAVGTGALIGLLSRALPAWRRFVEDIGTPDLLTEQGHFVVWGDERDVAARTVSRRAAAVGTACSQDASMDELADLSALLPGKIRRAVRIEGTGQVTDMDRLAANIELAFLASGGVRRQARAELQVRYDGTAAVLLETGDRLEAEAIIVAAGAASGRLLRPAGHRVPIIAERGYHIQAPASAWPATLPPLVFEDLSMIVTRFAGHLRAASFMEFGSLHSPPDRRKWDRLRRHAAALGLPFDEEPTQWSGARPTLPDYLPAIGRSARASNLLYAFGHQHLGLTLGPLTGEIVVALVCGEELGLDLSPLDLARFA